MKRRNFIRLTATAAGGFLVLPQFLTHANAFVNTSDDTNDNILVFIQLNGGNDGLNTFIPYTDPLYYEYRKTIGIDKNKVVNMANGMGFHPALKDFAQIAQEGNLTMVQNVGYPHPNRSHFRSQEIWQTATDANKYAVNGWLGRFLDIQCNDDDIAAINVDGIDNLALKSKKINNITFQDFAHVNQPSGGFLEGKLSDNPQLDFVRKIALSSVEGMQDLKKALQKAKNPSDSYANNPLSKNLQWISKLIKGDLKSKIYYTSLNGFDTHNNQLSTQQTKFTVLNDAVFSFYNDLKNNNLLNRVTLVIFSEFGRRVKDNGSGTDHGTAAPMMIIGGGNKGKIIGKNPDLVNLDQGDLIFENDFRAVYASLLKNKFSFDPSKINIYQNPIANIF